MADSRVPRTSDGSGSASPAPAVTRAAAVLEALASSATGRLTLSDLARELGIPVIRRAEALGGGSGPAGRSRRRGFRSASCSPNIQGTRAK